MGKNVSQPGRAALISLGCKVNTYESQGMAELLEKAGYVLVPADAEAELYLVNTCTVTQIAARKSRQMLRSLRRDHRGALIVATGCYVEQMDTGSEDILLEKVRSDAAEELLRDGTVDLIVPNRRKKDLLAILGAYLEARDAALALARSSREEEELFITSQEERTRAFLKVQDGCRQFCSYCIIPYVRGPLTSKPLDDAVREAEGLAENGFSELVLTGIHLSSYGRGEDYGLADLILAVDRIPGIRRIRLGSLEPRVMTEEFLSRVAAAKKLCPHFHLSLQSGCDRTLAAMNRHYSAEEYAETLARIRRYFPGAALTTDVIVGFPGETEEDHEASLAFVERMRFAQVHVFRYSRREGTVADRRPDQIPEPVKKRRSEQMLAVTEKLEKEWILSHAGRPLKVLAEEEEEGLWFGHTEDYLLVGIKDTDIRRGETVRVLGTALGSSQKGLYLEAERSARDASSK